MTATLLTGREAAGPEDRAAGATMRSDRRFLWFWLVVASTLSVGGNVGHAWLTVLPAARHPRCLSCQAAAGMRCAQALCSS